MTDHGEAAAAWPLAALLRAARTAGPEALPALVVDAGRGVGAEDVGIYLVDHEQRQLWPLRTGQHGDRDPHDVEASLAGRTYRTLEPLESSADGGVRLWLPLLDGSDRLGVLAADMADSPDPSLADSLWELALLTAELLVSKGAYSDIYEDVCRREHATLPTEVQQELLPPLTMATADVALAGTLEPSYAVAGDAFDYAVNATTLHWVMLDAMGHGLEAALLASVAVGAHRHARQRRRDLQATLTEMDTVVGGHFGGDRFLTGLIGELDRRSGEFRMISAGHHPPLLAREGTVIGELAATPALPIGLNDGAIDTAGVHQQLQPGDRVLAYTDGVIEARTPEDDSLFGLDRLCNLLERELADQQPAPEAMRRLMRRVLDHQQGQLQDDAMLLLLEWFGQPER